MKTIPLFQFDYSTVGLFRCTQRLYANMFCQGKIFFGSPKNWIDKWSEGNTSQGDILEGTFYSCIQGEFTDLENYLNEDHSIEHFNHNGFTYYRRKKVCDLRCLCLYGLHNNSFVKEIDADGRAHYKTSITKEYFSGFTECKSLEDYKTINSDDQPVLIIIKNISQFIDRLRSFLYTLDVKSEEIIISPVEYVDRNVSAWLNVPEPMELLVKDNSYKAQCEVRIIINSQSSKYKEYMFNSGNVIDIGTIEDITTIYDYYFDDMELERRGNRGLMFSLPEPRTYNINDMDFFELQDLLLNVVGGTVTLTNVPDDHMTLQEKLKPVIDLFKEKFGVVVFVERHRITMCNLSDDLLNESKVRDAELANLDAFVSENQRLLCESKPHEVLVNCNKALDDDNLGGAAYYYAAKAHTAIKNYSAAEQSFFESYKRDYKRIESLDGIAMLCFQCNRFEEAINLYNKIQDIKGFDCEIWLNIGLCYIHLEKYCNAIVYFDKIIERNKDFAPAYYNKGIALLRLNKKEEAKLCFEMSLELEPNNEYQRSWYDKLFSES